MDSVIKRAHRLRNAYEKTVALLPFMSNHADDPIKAGHDVAVMLIEAIEIIKRMQHAIVSVSGYDWSACDDWEAVQDDAIKFIAKVEGEVE